ncbi:MAG TPA: thioredoxin family protein [Polyangiaceae bacterium]|nr:thioredoxin family protein [Polyangiaceae bacterium]
MKPSLRRAGADRLLAGLVYGLSCWGLFACTAQAPQASRPPDVAPRTSAQPSAASPPAPASEHGKLHWFENEAEQAFAEARRTGKPLLADLWAPWCHTCLAMQAEVLTAQALPRLQSDVVLLAIDTERPENAAFLQEFPVGVWPTFYVLDPTTRQTRGRWLGAASAAQLSQFLSDSASPPASPPLISLREADALSAKKDFVGAAAKYRAALAAAPGDWPRRGDVLVSLISALAKSGDDAGCLELALHEGRSLGRTVSAGDFAATGLSCAERAAAGGASVDGVRRTLVEALTPVCELGAASLSADDRADACASLRRVDQALGDHAGAKAAAERGLSVIDDVTRDAPPRTQLIHDWARSEALVYLERRDEAIARLIERERQLPDNYNPPHYLARLYRDAKQWEPGLLAIDRALALAYGPRRAGLMGVKVDLLLGAGRKGDARALLDAQLAAYRALPPAQRQPSAEAAIEKRIGSWK